MVAYFLANQIVMGKLDFARVPLAFHAQVKEILTDAGRGDLCDAVMG